MTKLKIITVALMFAMSVGALVISLWTARQAQMDADYHTLVPKTPKTKSQPLPTTKHRQLWV